MGILDYISKAITPPTGTTLPVLATTDENRNRMQTLMAVLDSVAKSAANNNENNTRGSMAPVGLDAVVQDWVRQQFIYRRSILQDLYVMAFQSAEIRSVLLTIKREVFRRGFGEWEQKFIRKCDDCGKEFEDDDIESCDTCYLYEITNEFRYDEGTGERKPIKIKRYFRDDSGNKIPTTTRPPDITQQARFNEILNDANTFHKPILDTLNEWFTDILIADDGFFLTNFEYTIDNDTGDIIERYPFEFTRLHPALVEVDIERKWGIPEQSHFLCPVHRFQQIATGPGHCDVYDDINYKTCNAKLLPAMYRYYNRGRYTYYTKDEITHRSYFDPSKSYGYSLSNDTRIMTSDGFKSYTELKPYDRIMTLNPKTREIEYHPYNYKWHYQFTGDAVKIKSRYIDALVTPNHRMFVQTSEFNDFDVTPAEELVNAAPHKYLRGDFVWDGIEDNLFVLPSCLKEVKGPNPVLGIIPAETYGEFLAYYYAGGNTVHNKNITIYYHTRKDQISKCLDSLPIKFIDTDSTFLGGNRIFATHLKTLFPDKNKILESIPGLPYRAQVGFLKGCENLDILPINNHNRKKIAGLQAYADSLILPVKDDEIEVMEIDNLIEPQVFSSLSIQMDDWLALLGYYLSEGSTYKYREVKIDQSLEANPEKYAKMWEDLQRTPFKWRKDKNGFRSYSPQLTSYMKQFGYAKDKFVPGEFKQLSTRQLRILFDALMLGDGSDGRKYTTTSSKLRDDMMEMGLKLGLCATFATKEFTNGWTTCYVVSFSEGNPTPTLQSKHYSHEKYDDYMWCLDLPPYHNFVVNRNGKTYITGNSPVLTVFEKVLTLIGVDRLYYRYLYERRIPPGLIITYTDNPDALESEIERIKMQLLEDPATFPWIAASAKTQRGKTDHVRLNYLFEEMDTIAVRQEIRERISMLWGVTPMYQGDARSVGGLTRETAQTGMFENLIESYQNVINNGPIPAILVALGITDWTIKLHPPKEKGEQEMLELEALRIQNATAMQNIGYKAIKSRGRELRFTFEEAPGMPGIGPGGPPGLVPPQESMQPGQTEGELPLPPPPQELDEQA